MPLTPQQQVAVDAVIDPDIALVKIKACAGSGKTFTLIEATKAYNPKSGIYLAYNKAIAEEAAQKFKGTNIKCSTIHSLAYRAVVNQYNLKVGYFGVRNVQPATLPYKEKLALVNLIEDFCLSAFIDPSDFLVNTGVDLDTRRLFMRHLDQFTNGHLTCNHSFYLKLYHVFLTTGEIQPPNVDLLLLDEAGDVTELTLDIFRLIKAKKKVAVGDPYQNIYGFNNTINAFVALENEGVEVQLSQSFRVSVRIASSIQAFVRKHLNEDFVFEGVQYGDGELITQAYIARGNTGLVEHMFSLINDNVPFHTTRNIGTILEFPLILANIDNGKPITGSKYKHIERLRKQWLGNKRLQAINPTILKYIQYIAKVEEDEEMARACKVVEHHGAEELKALAKYGTKCAKQDCNLTLTTAHSSKGLEFSSVEFAPDMDENLTNLTQKFKVLSVDPFDIYGSYTPAYLEMQATLDEEYRLYYVAASRSMYQLTNAKHLPKGII